MSKSELELTTEIMKDTRIAILTYRSASGDLVSTPMGTQDFEDPSTVWFITEVTSDKVAAIKSDPRVNVSYSSDKGWVSLAATAKVNMDRDKLTELWDASAGIFMTGGPNDAENGLLEVTANTAEYWESPGKVTSVVQMAKGLLTDAEPDLGDSGIVNL